MATAVNRIARAGTVFGLMLAKQRRFPSGDRDRDADTCRHIVIRSARDAVMLPSGHGLYQEHVLQLDGVPNQPVILAHVLRIAR
jgi:hypothetical protein